MDHADDVLRLAAEDRDAGVRRVDRLREDRVGRRLGVDHLDVAAVHHHLLDLRAGRGRARRAAGRGCSVSTAPSEWCSAIAPAISGCADSGRAPSGRSRTPNSRSTSRARPRTAVDDRRRAAPPARPIGRATRSAVASGLVIAQVLGITSAKTSTSAVIATTASATPPSPNSRVKSAVASDGGEDVGEGGAEQDRADQPLLVLGQRQRAGGAAARRGRPWRAAGRGWRW